MKLSTDEIKNIASLAQLSLTEEEVALYQEQLSSVLEYMEMLGEVDTNNVPITSQVTGLEDVYREDAVVECPKDQRRKIIEQFPQEQDNALHVPAVFE